MIGNGTGAQFRAELAERIVELKDVLAEEARTLAERLRRKEAQAEIERLKRELGARAEER